MVYFIILAAIQVIFSLGSQSAYKAHHVYSTLFFINWKRNFTETCTHLDPQGVVQAIFLGETKNVPREVIQIFQNAGLLHLLAASGFNCLIVSLFFSYFSLGILTVFFKRFQLFTYLQLKRFLYPLSAIFGAWLFWLWSDQSPPITRAAVSVTLVFLIHLLQMQTSIARILALQYFISICIYPDLFLNPSFQLTFSCIFGLILVPKLGKIILERLGFNINQWGWFLRGLTNYFLSNLGATLGSLPITFFFFREINFMGMFTNWLAVPWTSFLLMPPLLLAMLCSIPVLKIHTLLVMKMVLIKSAVEATVLLLTALKFLLKILPDLRFILPP